MESGEFRRLDPDAAAVDIVALIDGLGIQAFFELGHITPAAARRRLGAAIREQLLPAPSSSSPG